MNVIVADGSRTGSHWGWASLSSMPGIATVTVVDVGDDCHGRGRWMTVGMVIVVGRRD